MLKCTAFFSLGIQGWSETWFLDGANLNTANTPINTLVAARLRMCPATVTHLGSRVSVVENPAVFRKLNSNGIGSYSTSRDVTNLAIIWTAVSDNYTRRLIYTRGTPDDCVSGGAYAGTSEFAAAAANWATVIVAVGFGIRTIDRNNALQDVATIDGTGLLTTYADYGWDKPDRLKFHRARYENNKPIVASYRIGARLNGTTYQLVGWPAGRVAINVRARKLIYVLQVPNTIINARAATRKTGRPFGLRAGRRRVTVA